jgi:plasmid stabilization system protein ParE
VKRYLVAPEAENDLRQIWRYLRREAGPAIADRIQGELVDAFENLAAVPGKGHKRSDLTSSDVLFFSVIHDRISARDVAADRCRLARQTRCKAAPQDADVIVTYVRRVVVQTLGQSSEEECADYGR